MAQFFHFPECTRWRSRQLARAIERIGKRKRYSTLPALRQEFCELQFSGLAFQKLLDDFEFDTVLDIGSGVGDHAKAFIKHGKRVTAIDYGRSPYFEKSRVREGLELIISDFNEVELNKQFDCIWCSHILEHQLNPHSFLRKVNSLTKEGGIVAITVPPLKHEIVGGHVSLWNAGLLLYHLVLAGFDCTSASVLKYGYNISLIVRKRTINVLDQVSFDSGDIRKLKRFLPHDIEYNTNDFDDPFSGDIEELNWISQPRY